jgi:hypothetical protein
MVENKLEVQFAAVQGLFGLFLCCDVVRNAKNCANSAAGIALNGIKDGSNPTLLK